MSATQSDFGLAAGGAPDAPPFEDIRRLTASIHRWNVASESVYLAVGEAIHALHRSVSQVRDGIRASTEVFLGAEIVEMRQGLAGAADESRGAAALAAERFEALARLRAAVEIAASGSAAVLQVFRLLDYVVLIARAQVEGMSEGQDELGPFTAHVDELVTVGEGVARGIDRRTQFLGHCLAESRAIETQADLGGTAMIEDFLALAGQLEARQRKAGEQRDEAHAAFTSIWKAIGGVVAGLQFHDMARQRLEHTIRNLERLPDLEASGVIAEGAEPVGEASRPAALRRVLSLEIAQLADLALLYETKMAELDGNLALIAGEVDRSAAVLGELLRGSAGETGAASLDAEAARLEAHFRDGQAGRLRLVASLEQCVEATQALLGMTGQLDDLEHELKIAGLNAAVRAAHVKSGENTIGYIARVICEQASTARSEADRVHRGIELAVVDTRDLSQRILPAISAAEEAIRTRLVGTTAVLGHAQASSARALGGAAGVAGQLPDAVATVRRMMTPHVEGCDLMRTLGAALAGIAARIPASETGAGEDMAAFDAVLSAQYTMAEERAIFAAVVGRPPERVPEPAGAAADAAPAPGSDEDLDDILF